jgi:uncharacterized damage-inducible protein DinB
MSRSTLEDPFAHHVWATLRLIEACRALTPTQLASAVPGTYGSIIDTLRHLVRADRGYLVALTAGEVPILDQDGMDLAALQVAMEADGVAWVSLLAQDPDPDTIVVRRRSDGSESHVPSGILLAQAVHHGTDHRSQVCTALTAIDVEPPAIDVWSLADQDGRLLEVPPPA